MAIVQVFVTILSTIINSFPNRKLLNYGYFEQLKDIFPNLFIAILMFIVVYIIGYLDFNNVFLLMLLQILVGAVFYMFLMSIFKLESYIYLLNIIKNKFKEVRK